LVKWFNLNGSSNFPIANKKDIDHQMTVGLIKGEV